MRQKTADFLIGGAKTDKTWDFLLRHKIFSWDRIQEIFSLGGPKLIRHEIFSWDLRFSYETDHFLIQPPSTRKSPVSCLMRKSHVSRENLMSYQFLPPQWENLLSPVLWENLMSQDKISCLFSFGPPPMRKSPVFCLMRKSHVPWDFLLGFMEKAWDMRISHETGDFLSRQETGDFPIGGGVKNW